MQTLRTGKVYFAARRELNDPFDCRVTPDFSTAESRRRITEKTNQRLDEWEKIGRDIRALGAPEAAEREEFYRKFIADSGLAVHILRQIWSGLDSANIGVCCLTEDNDSLPMWAHYASNHSGCCLEFNFEGHVLREVHHGKSCFPFTLLKMVRYSSKYPLANLERDSSPLAPTSAFLIKSTEWQDEKEWRAIMPDARVMTPFSKNSLNKSARHDFSWAKKMKGVGLYKVDEGIIRGVILGCEMAEADKAPVITAARECGVRIYQAKPKIFQFGLDIIPMQDGFSFGNRA